MKQQGFTLIEILVVVVIMALMLATATVGFGRGEQQRFISQSQQLQAWLGQVQNEAILTSNIWGVRFDETEAKAYVMAQGSWMASADIETYVLKDAIRISHLLREGDDAIDPNKPDVIIMPTGQLLPPGLIQLSSNEAKRTLTWTSGKILLENIE